MNKPLAVKENDEHALDFAFHISCLFYMSVSVDFSIGRILALSQGHNCKFSSCHQRSGFESM
jgi:hypothetical protein